MAIDCRRFRSVPLDYLHTSNIGGLKAMTIEEFTRTDEVRIHIGAILKSRSDSAHTVGSPILKSRMEDLALFVYSLSSTDPRLGQLARSGADFSPTAFLYFENWSSAAIAEPEAWFDRFVGWVTNPSDNS